MQCNVSSSDSLKVPELANARPSRVAATNKAKIFTCSARATVDRTYRTRVEDPLNRAELCVIRRITPRYKVL